MPQPATRVRPTGHPGYSETLPREPESATAARRLVRVALSAWGLDDLAPDAALIVTELVSNAVRHARREYIRVVVDRPGPAQVRLGVVDFSQVQPVRGQPDPERESGCGLVLVEELAERWGTDPLPYGKRVWADLRGRGER
ncbi:ATP-binding protein [Streptomyces sp. NBC_00178]|uniref:ATP-binding protein n=1 Tax=Streptomyces sp. NBC_00178 TaxID=2975672 RepID=UPI002E2ABD23|nr:ATP-binding protein [Streptomyces sp. NBC_00178]